MLHHSWPWLSPVKKTLPCCNLIGQLPHLTSATLWQYLSFTSVRAWLSCLLVASNCAALTSLRRSFPFSSSRNEDSCVGVWVCVCGGGGGERMYAALSIYWKSEVALKHFGIHCMLPMILPSQTLSSSSRRRRRRRGCRVRTIHATTCMLWSPPHLDPLIPPHPSHPLTFESDPCREYTTRKILRSSSINCSLCLVQ